VLRATISGGNANAAGGSGALLSHSGAQTLHAQVPPCERRQLSTLPRAASAALLRVQIGGNANAAGGSGALLSQIG
jgi:hypothetical protein